MRSTSPSWWGCRSARARGWRWRRTFSARRFKAFSSAVDTGSREENASKQESSLELLPGRECVDQASAGGAGIARIRRFADVIVAAGGIGGAVDHAARGAAQNGFGVRRRQPGVLLHQQSAHAGKLRRRRRGAAENAPSVGRPGAVARLRTFLVDLAGGWKR